MAVTLEQFVENIVASGLMSADEISAFQAGLSDSESAGDTKDLAKQLVRQNKLTKYQATAIYKGETEHLVFGEYVMVDEIGEGGMGKVLKAHHRRMDRFVAVKVLSEKVMRDADAEARFYREVKAAAKLTHPNIVHAYDASQHKGMHYLVMEYVDGNDLASVVYEHGYLPVEEAVECTIQAARGLQYAHDKGIVHRDIKPGNLLLDKDGTVKILDMGLARLAGDDVGDKAGQGRRQLTQSGQIMGTVDYMAPEQAEDTHSADHRADIYSLGCTLFRLLTAQPLYDRDTVMRKLLSHREDAIPSLLELREGVSARLNGVFQRMVAKHPDERYQSMTEVITALQTSLIPAPQVARPAPQKESSSSMALSEFFQQVSGTQLQTVKQTPATTDETIDRQPESEETGDELAEVEPLEDEDEAATPSIKYQRIKARKRQKQVVLLGAAGAASIGLLIVLCLALFEPSEPGPVGESELTKGGSSDRVGKTSDDEAGRENPDRLGTIIQSTDDIDRQVAMMAFTNRGPGSAGYVELMDFGRITEVGALPKGRFKVISAALHSISSEQLLTVCKLSHVADLSLLYPEISGVDLSCITSLTHLKNLRLAGVKNLTDDALRYISACTNLESLQIGDPSCTFTAAGIAHLSRLKELRSLTLSGQIDDDGAAEIVRSVAVENLTELGIGYASAMTDDGIRRILQSLNRAKCSRIGLSNTAASDSVLPILQEFDDLYVVKLYGCPQITDAGLKTLSNLKNLDVLEVVRTSVTKEGVEALKESLPDCVIHSDFDVK